MKFSLFSLLFLSFSCFSSTQIELVTMGPGGNYWEAFGHSAIRIKTNDQDLMYGFGYFNFDDEDFFINFAKGEMQYFLGVEYSEYEFNDYKSQGRHIWTQKLKLTENQKNKLIDKLNNLAQEQNKYYHYDYFLSNCTSKIRDILDEISHGDISRQLKGVEIKRSWSDSTFPVSNQSWMNLGIAIAYGIPAYLQRDQWDLSIFPEDFANDIQNLTTTTHWNTTYQIYYQPTIPELKSKDYSFIKTHYAVISLCVILLMGLLFKFTKKVSVKFWLIMQSILGFCVLLLWFFTQHSVAALNLNVLVFFPLSFLLMFHKFQTKTYLTAFLLINISWFLLSLFFTQLYLVGFYIINIVIYLNLIKLAKNKLCLFNI